MARKLRVAADTALVMIGICTAIQWGGSAAYAFGSWVGAH